MNPRVSRSSALASKATGFPIAKIAAKLAVGYTLDEVQNDITQGDAGLLRAGDRLRVVKYPRWAFEKFPAADSTLSTQMKSVGEVDGHRPHVQGGLQEGHALARDRAGLRHWARDGKDTRPWNDKDGRSDQEEEVRAIPASRRVPTRMLFLPCAGAWRTGDDG